MADGRKWRFPIAVTRLRSAVTSAGAVVLGAAILGAVVAGTSVGERIRSTEADGQLGHAQTAARTTSGGAATLPDGRAGTASLSASLQGGRFELTGVVPRADVANAIRTNAATVYGVDIVDRLTVDPDIGDAAWLATAADLIVSLPIISEGTIRLEANVATITGTAGSTAKRDQFREAVGELIGRGVEIVDEVMVDVQPPPELVIRKSGAHTIELSGVVPSEEVRAEIESTIFDAYGGYAIETALVIDPGVEETFALHSLPIFAELFFGFPAWELSYVDETLQSSSSGSAAFDVDSAMVPPLGEQILDNVAVRLAGTPGLALTVEGHTDAVGAMAYNQALSERRAQAVVDYLVLVHDVDPGRLTALGFGEMRPIDDNDTAAGRERNRRVDFRFALER